VDLQVRVQLPDAEAIQKIEQKRLVSYVYIGPEKLEGNELGENRVQVDDALVPELTEIRQLMFRRLQEEPRTIISLRVDEESETGILYDVQQELREAGTLRINYSTKRLIPS
jgi:biopolymer transport protein ExbD